MENKVIKSVEPLGFPWATQDPFLFCVHHADAYPAGNGKMGPAASLSGRNIGQDFTLKDGWRMYHGSEVPGFPAHPHRGFETVTVVLKGLVDHADSLGAAGRFGNGDVQWMTAGKGVQHSEMFPLLDDEAPNPLELFQIWLNLPKASKFVPAHFHMLWRETIPIVETTDDQGKAINIRVIAGQLADATAPAPAPDSWAADEANGVAIWNIKLEAGATWTLPKAEAGMNRALYYYEGDAVQIAGQGIGSYQKVELDPIAEVPIQNGETSASFLLLQGRPIAEPVAQYGPFVMNNQAEIQQAFMEFQQTQFGGWPWPTHEHTHPKESGRFAKHADGTEEFK